MLALAETLGDVRHQQIGIQLDHAPHDRIRRNSFDGARRRRHQSRPSGGQMGGGGLRLTDDVVELSGQQRGPQRLGIGEQPVHGHAAGPGPPGDIGHRGSSHAHGGDALAGRVEQGGVAVAS